MECNSPKLIQLEADYLSFTQLNSWKFPLSIARKTQ